MLNWMFWDSIYIYASVIVRRNMILEKHWVFSAFGDNQEMYPGEAKTTVTWSIHDIFVLNIKLIHKLWR